jgi:diacylglycerol kinase family enzyme
VTQYRAKEVSFASAEPAGSDLIAYADGERVAALPIRIRCVPAALPVLVPVGGSAPGR